MDNAATTLVGTEKRKTNGMWELHGSGGVTICIIGARADSIGRPTKEFTSLGIFALALLPVPLASQHLFRTQPFQSPIIFTILSNGTKILKAVKVSQKKQTPYILPFVCWQAVLIGFPETQQQFCPKVQRSNPSPLTLWLASTFVTCCTRFALHHTHKISYLYFFRVLEKHTLAKGVTLDFKQIRRGINSRTISRHGVEYIKDLIIKTGQQIIV